MTMTRFVRSFLLLPWLLWAAAPAAAQEGTPPEETDEERSLWAGSAGVSYLATSGNSDTETLGIDLDAKRRPTPWGLGIEALFHRAEETGVKTAERYLVGLRGTRTLAERWEAFSGVSAERDEFAGFDLRGVVEAGATYKALLGPRHTLGLEGGVTWTDERRLPPEVDESWLGGLAGARYELALKEGASFSQRLRVFANFDQASDWRAESVTALTAALNARLALRVSHEVRYRNEPLADNEDTDSTTKVSLVWSL